MGAALSLVSSTTIITILVVSVGYAYLFHSGQVRQPFPDPFPAVPKEKISGPLKKKSKKKQPVTKEVETSATEDTDVKVPGLEPSTSSGVKSKSDEPKPTVVSFPTILPGSFGGDTTTSAVEVDTDAGASLKPKKKKKGKSKRATTEGAGSSGQVEEKSDAAGHAESSSLGRSGSSKKRQSQSGQGGAGLDDSEVWTRVESRRKQRLQPSDSKGLPQDTVSDTGITTSVTGNSSPPTEDEAGPIAQPGSSSVSKDNQSTLAEKSIPMPRKTGVEE